MKETERMAGFAALREQVVSSQRDVCLPYIARGVEFLLSARSSAIGWGAYAGIAAELHYSALAIEALYLSADERAVGPVADVALQWSRRYADRVDALDLSDAIDLLVLLRSQIRPDEDLTSRLGQLVLRRLAEAGRARDPERLRSVSLTLLALNNPQSVQVQIWNSWLVTTLEEIADLAAPNGLGAGALITAAVALRVVAEQDDNRSCVAASRLSQLLLDSIRRDSWARLDGSADTFILAHVLRAVTKSREVRAEEITAGVSTLRALQNADGGWGGVAGAPSSIEHSSLALSALVACGENRVVPLRVADAVLVQAAQLAESLGRESAILRADLNSAVSRECGAVVKERDDLRLQMQRVRREMLSMRKRSGEVIQEVQGGGLRRIVEDLRERLELAGRVTARTAELSTLLFFIALGSLSLVLLSDLFSPHSDFFRLAGTLGAIASVIMALALMRRSERQTEALRDLWSDAAIGEEWELERDKSAPSASSLRKRFLVLSAEMPPSMREEMIYLLFREFLELPPDIADRFAEDLIMRLELPRNIRRPFASWLQAVSRLPVRERRLLFDQLRRGAL